MLDNITLNKNPIGCNKSFVIQNISRKSKGFSFVYQLLLFSKLKSV